MATRTSGWNRRQWLATAAASTAAGAQADAAEMADVPQTGKLYEALGVRPFINARGTFTILTGSQSLPEVKQAMLEASRHYVHLDELMDAVGHRIAELTKAEWGIVTAGCAAAITHATSACIAGMDPEKMQRLPKLEGLKDQVVMPRYARNEYDHAARMLGVTMIEVETEEQLQAALGPRTAMVLILSCPAAEKGPLTVPVICRIAREKNVPVLVDAAAETMTIPNIHLNHGATMVAYSGGKCMRGPQAAGLLLGPKDLLQAAWLNSAPHHAFGRSLKVGKEEIMGMLAALEAWVRRDHDAEWKQWESWLETIRQEACRVDGVTSEILQPEDLSNHAPRLRLKWDAGQVGITGQEVAKALDRGEPRIIVAGSTGERPARMDSSVTIMPYMMNPEDAPIVAKALHAALAHPPKIEPAPVSTAAPSQVAGRWTVHLQFIRGEATHEIALEQDGGKLSGTHKTTWMSNPLRGDVSGAAVQFRSAHRYEGTVLNYVFEGKLEGGTLSGEVRMGEYGTARWTASRVQPA
ncbi:aminotransferase class V-fold PLP-dependent enzyme [Paludibaculum fermentans]|uniref:Aminotransferase class V-fold PLP-dependent enzyme n=1 Tax=Paludibaculum fermentans TaxID=1473598 RepID=A0A7S7NUZ8_PALFE|nr:aminotransferase class V-fold PLP-dependent enzyme [Paludibaculum fermentans]QOY90303.1 aminotransferase class V-fold PLP-dependent enzyme [Paludibaculum fermentans]